MSGPCADGPTSTTRELSAPNDAPRLDILIAGQLDLSRNQAATLIASGRVSVDGRREKASYRARAGERIVVAIPAAQTREVLAEAIPLDVVYEDDDVLVVDKPAGMVVHPAAGNPDGTLVNALLHHCAGRLSGIGGVARPGIVHRIDKDTSGLLVVAKTDIAHEGLAAQFARHSIDRRYLSITAGIPVPAAGTIDAPLARSSANRKKIAIVGEGRGKRAVTHYRIVEPLKGAALVECRLETGRTHQVRVHMASIGHPLLGDPVYGRADPRGMMLHAHKLVVPREGKDPVIAEAPMPERFAGLVISSV